ncbi:GNAT family N-acetyltransferase [Shewanella surugensis]|uniref:GNAT family N-acetyltransferase n=1 Tax=Shewanella surugensis TaxID=212020 RepID=A0ABT0L5F8_9GAMM|nr:GNAT family N-acetyltransferase [Shewanella surugensis]MCL1122924.1 GNAT family N-acetyltransferase [Shewanella surugensis]
MDKNELKFDWLAVDDRRDVAAFYRQFMPYARLNRKEAIAVLKSTNEEIIASVRFRPVGELVLLTGLLVNPTWRGQKLGAILIKNSCPCLAKKSIYLFVEADLERFYQHHGFRVLNQGPNDIEQLLLKYQKQGKSLLMMQYFDN